MVAIFTDTMAHLGRNLSLCLDLKYRGYHRLTELCKEMLLSVAQNDSLEGALSSQAPGCQFQLCYLQAR